MTLAEAGADVAVSYERAAERAQAIVDRVAEVFGGIDILVNNAGTARIGPIADLGLEDVDTPLHVNVRGTVVTTKAAIRHLS